MKDVLRAALAVPALKVADVAFNQKEILHSAEDAAIAGAKLLVLPELALTGYSCGDLFLSELLRERVAEALPALAAAIPQGLLVALGAPLWVEGRLYNCAVMLGEGRILGAVPKSFLVDYGEGAERRWFSSGMDLETTLATLGCFTFPVGTDLLFRAADGTVIGAEICEDLNAPVTPGTLAALSGAEVLLNLSASGAAVGKRENCRRAVRERSARTHCAYLYVSAGAEESVADTVFSGQGLMALDGELVIENQNAVDSRYLLAADLDLGRVRFDRLHNRTFGECANRFACDAQSVDLGFALCDSDGALLEVERLPFIPSKKEQRESRCAEIFEIQSTALSRRLALTGGKAVLGISGGLDSTLALLVAIRAMEKLQLPAANITAVTMPCFGTSEETLANALELMETLGVTVRRVSIKNAVLQHFEDIGHAADDYSVTYENAQARERTQVLMDIANQVGGIVIGTGDLSEMALGWCTYNGDHMSMYGVNCDVPKTLVRFVIETLAGNGSFPKSAAVLGRILDTPISPELLPPDAVGKIAQKTEDIVGPYALHDFFLYWAVRYQYRPLKIYELACIAFDGLFDGAVIKKWLAVFWKRFFTQQFKRNCVPDGVKVGCVALSPRGDWRMPSDASAAEWMREIEEIEVQSKDSL